MSEQRISVVVRIRPPLERERYEPMCARKASDDQTITIKPEESAANMGEPVSFQFDCLFDENDGQQDVYEESVQELVDHALSGFNATVFTYGQTGSGKTFTILGKMSPDGAVNASSGIFLRVFNDLFNYKETVKSKVHLVITLSALELYVEDVMDLLANKNKLKLRETPEETLTMGIRTVEVRSMEDVVRNFEVANSFRSVTATKMNDASSRSHALFFIDLLQIPVDKCAEAPPLDKLIDANGSPVTSAAPGLVRSRIALVDLAGSERVKRSGVQGQGMVEAQAINKSLSTLGTVINAMYTQSAHIPFRESKLTKLLKTSFVETTSRLLLVGQVAPPSSSAQESLSTLRFCDRVKGLKAGQVMGFSDPEEEERYLHSLRLNEELTAEMRILRVQYFFEATNLRALAAERGTTLEAEKQRVTQELQAGAKDIIATKEQEAVQKMQVEAAHEQEAEVERFVLHMNALIEEYEEVATSAKRDKKALKKLSEEHQADQEAKVHEAKKAKKVRVKLEEQMAEIQAQVDAVNAEDAQLTQELSVPKDFDNDDAAGAAGEGDAESAMLTSASGVTPQMEDATHRLVETFVANCTEMNRLYAQFVERLDATGRQRALVRRQKLLSSTLVTDGTMLYDIIAFLIDRAVDIAEAQLPSQAKWSWYDIDGLSQQLLTAEQLYPPMLTDSNGGQRVSAHVAMAMQPCSEEYHKITFLSSDDSDDENSHHAAESRRQRKMRIRNGVQEEASSSEDSDAPSEADGEEAGTDSNRDDDENESAPVPKSTDWLNSLQQEAAAADSAKKRAKKSEREKKSAQESAADASGSPTVATAVPKPEAPSSPGTDGAAAGAEKKRKHSEKKPAAPVEEAAESGSEESAESDDEANEDEDKGAASPPEQTDAAADGEAKHKKKKKKHHTKAGATDVDATATAEDGEKKADADTKIVPTGPRGKELSADEASRAYVMQVYDSPTLVQALLKFLRSGSTFLKHGRSGKPHKRLFWVNITKTRREMLWMDPANKKSSRATIALDEVSYIQLGAFSKVFSRHPVSAHEPAFFRCFTIGLKGGGRTVDLIADSVPDYEAWVVGLSHLVGVDPAWGGKLDVTKEPGYERLTYFESILCESNYIYPSDYLTMKKAVQNVATRTMKVLQDCGNDRQKAFDVVGGIHLPGIDQKGAVYLTKGELRFLCPELNIDIFRITHVWMHFQQTNLVFDDNFLPATPFGVTKRD